MNTPTKASTHFKKLGWCNIRKKNLMQCKHCLKDLVDTGNGTGKTDHLRACRPNLALTNKVKGVSLFQIEMTSSSDSSGSTASSPTTPKPNTPLKEMLLSQTPYHIHSVERNKMVYLLLQLVVDMNLPISMVDHPSFVKYSSGLNNRFKIPCRQTMTKTVIPQKVS